MLRRCRIGQSLPGSRRQGHPGSILVGRGSMGLWGFESIESLGPDRATRTSMCSSALSSSLPPFPPASRWYQAFAIHACGHIWDPLNGSRPPYTRRSKGDVSHSQGPHPLPPGPSENNTVTVTVLVTCTRRLIHIFLSLVRVAASEWSRLWHMLPAHVC